MKPKSINALMANMRNNKRINIQGSTQKKKLRYMGYFHGYKGYRYCRVPANRLPFSDFNELQSVYDFDMRIKTIIYPAIMFIETALKNYALECVVSNSKSESFAEVFSNSLTNYKSFPVGNSDFKAAMRKRLELRNHIYSTISRDYKKDLVHHYYDKDESVPIWAIFELMTLGEFGTFVSCLDDKLKKSFSKEIGIKASFDPDGKIPEMLIFAIKDLRNAVAHNGIIFDTRFKTANISSRISTYIQNETSIKGVAFDTILDYLVLIIVIMKGLKNSKPILIALVNDFEREYEALRKRIPVSLFNQIAYTNTRPVLILLKKYIKK